MLTRDLLRYRLVGDQAQPQFLRHTPAIIEIGEALLLHWRSNVGNRVGDITDASLPILHQSRALVVGRGLQKIIIDACESTEPTAATALRAEAFAASAALLAKPDKNSDTHAQRIADAVNLSVPVLQERLYGDLPDQAVLASAPTWTVKQLIDRYNMALAQGLVLFAQSLRIDVHDADTGVRRRLLKAMRFRRLLATVHGGGSEVLSLEISGPGSVLEQANRYGMQLALFLPALACCKNWQAQGLLRLPHAGTANLQLNEESGLIGDNVFLGYVPEELQLVQDTLAKRFPSWAWEEPPLLTHPSGELVVPDMALRHCDQQITVEFFHRWHGHAVERRLAQLAAGWGHHHVIGIDRAIAKRTPGLEKHPAFKQHGFLFSDFPTPKALGEVVERMTGQI
jgi:uncharacterized protein